MGKGHKQTNIEKTLALEIRCQPKREFQLLIGLTLGNLSEEFPNASRRQVNNALAEEGLIVAKRPPYSWGNETSRAPHMFNSKPSVYFVGKEVAKKYRADKDFKDTLERAKSALEAISYLYKDDITVEEQQVTNEQQIVLRKKSRTRQNTLYDSRFSSKKILDTIISIPLEAERERAPFPVGFCKRKLHSMEETMRKVTETRKRTIESAPKTRARSAKTSHTKQEKKQNRARSDARGYKVGLFGTKEIFLLTMFSLIGLTEAVISGPQIQLDTLITQVFRGIMSIPASTIGMDNFAPSYMADPSMGLAIGGVVLLSFVAGYWYSFDIVRPRDKYRAAFEEHDIPEPEYLAIGEEDTDAERKEKRAENARRRAAFLSTSKTIAGELYIPNLGKGEEIASAVRKSVFCSDDVFHRYIQRNDHYVKIRYLEVDGRWEYEDKRRITDRFQACHPSYIVKATVFATLHEPKECDHFKKWVKYDPIEHVECGTIFFEQSIDLTTISNCRSLGVTSDVSKQRETMFSNFSSSHCLNKDPDVNVSELFTFSYIRDLVKRASGKVLNLSPGL